MGRNRTLPLRKLSGAMIYFKNHKNTSFFFSVEKVSMNRKKMSEAQWVREEEKLFDVSVVSLSLTQEAYGQDWLGITISKGFSPLLQRCCPNEL